MSDPKTEELRITQTQRAQDERRREQDAGTEDDARAHDRRAEKAAYLAAKLAEQEQSESES